jgi:hypothetical protein
MKTRMFSFEDREPRLSCQAFIDKRRGPPPHKDAFKAFKGSSCSKVFSDGLNLELLEQFEPFIIRPGGFLPRNRSFCEGGADIDNRIWNASLITRMQRRNVG